MGEDSEEKGGRRREGGGERRGGERGGGEREGRAVERWNWGLGAEGELLFRS